MSPSRSILVVSLVLLNLVLVAGAYQIGRRVQKNRDDVGLYSTQAMLAFGHYKLYGIITGYLEKKCYDAALTEARDMRNGMIVIFADNLRRTGNDPDLLEYVRLRDADLLKSVLAGHTPDLPTPSRPITTSCP
jgi:hypothetical protein